MIRIGTSGWSYADWRGAWYPPGLPSARMLAFYATVFDAVEVNATYYRVPGRKSAEGMVRESAGRLHFAIKAPGDVTHGLRMDEEALTPWRRFLEPFVEHGCLGAVLLQFPQRFHAGVETMRHLRALCGRLGGLPVVVEMRHRSWDGAEARRLLGEQGVSRALVDQPDLRGLSRAGGEAGHGAIGYVRFHGRNAGAWYAEGSAHERYRYSYSREELQEWVPIVKESAAKATSTFAFFNNHPDGNAPRDAETFAALLGQPPRGTGYRDLFS